MKFKMLVRVGIMVGIALLLAPLGLAQETKVTEKQVPRAVIAAFRASYPTAPIKGLSKERENGKIYYEISSESTDGETTVDILYKPDGTVVEIEESISAEELPQEAQETLRTKFANAELKTIERSVRGELVTFEVHARVGRKIVELKFDASGKQIK